MGFYRTFTAVWGFFSAISAFAQTNVTLNFQVSGAMRSAVIHVPDGISKPPVVFFVHGAYGTGPNFQKETAGDVTADREKFIAVYPSAGGNNIWTDMSGIGNFPFFLALIDTLDARYKIDRNRIYMTGFSQGGMISYAAACYYSDIFAAVAPVSGHIDKAKPNCPIKRPVPVFMTFGALEIKPDLEKSFLPDWTQWLKLNQCPSTPPTITKPYPANKPNSKVTRVAYGPCAEGSSLIIDTISGQDHQWPSPNNLVQADEVWTFFKQYSLNTNPNRIQKNTLAAHRGLSVQYAFGTVNLGVMEKEQRVKISNAQGKEVATATTHQGRFDFKEKSSGIYWVSVMDGRQSKPQKFVVP